MRASLARLAFLVIATLPSMASAGAWTQAKDNALLALSATYYTGDKYFDNTGRLRPQARYSKQGISAYGEWGYSDSLTFGANIFADRVSQSDKHNYALANTELFARQCLWHDNTRVISLQPLVKLPTMARHGGVPQSGSESWDAELALQYGESLALLSGHDFIDLAAALRMRSDGLSPQWRTESRYGITLTDKWTLVSALYLTQSMKLDTPAAFREGGDLDYHLSKAEISALYHLDDTHYWQLSGSSHVSGTQTGAGQALSLTYGMRF